MKKLLVYIFKLLFHNERIVGSRGCKDATDPTLSGVINFNWCSKGRRHRCVRRLLKKELKINRVFLLSLIRVGCRYFDTAKMHQIFFLFFLLSNSLSTTAARRKFRRWVKAPILRWRCTLTRVSERYLASIKMHFFFCHVHKEFSPRWRSFDEFWRILNILFGFMQDWLIKIYKKQ